MHLAHRDWSLTQNQLSLQGKSTKYPLRFPKLADANQSGNPEEGLEVQDRIQIMIRGTIQRRLDNNISKSEKLRNVGHNLRDSQQYK